MNLIRSCRFRDGSKPETSEEWENIEAGRHEAEWIPNPYRHTERWIVLKGTKIGAPESSVRKWDDVITIEE